MQVQKRLANWVRPKVFRLVPGKAEGQSLEPLGDNQLFS